MLGLAELWILVLEFKMTDCYCSMCQKKVALEAHLLVSCDVRSGCRDASDKLRMIWL